jgi:NAD(P)-dependent dehydrogenase (short-subunit alcohol dehydrogenase family)
MLNAFALLFSSESQVFYLFFPSQSRRFQILFHSFSSFSPFLAEILSPATTMTDAKPKILVVGGAGTIGQPVVQLLSERYAIIIAGRNTGDVKVDITKPESIEEMYKQVGPVDHVICCAGGVAFAPLTALTAGQWDLSLQDKLMGQIRLVQIGAAGNYVKDKGSFTLTSGIISDSPIFCGAAAAVANAGVNAYAVAAAIELPRGLRINVVSPTVVTESLPQYGAFFRGYESAPAAKVARAYSKSVDGLQTGQIYRVVE